MLPRRGLATHAIGKAPTALILVVVAIVVIIGLAVGPLSHASPGSSNTASSTSSAAISIPTASNSTSNPALDTNSSSSQVIISDMEVDVVGVGIPNMITNNSVVNSGYFGGAQQYSGPSGTPFTLAVELTFNGCTNSGAECPASITNVTIQTPGFSVGESVPSLPMAGGGGALEDFNFVITVVPTVNTYNGPLNILCQTA